MHPLAISLDSSVHKHIYLHHDGPTKKRRTSLDNSCLSAAHASLQLLMNGSSDHSDEFEHTSRPRRFSLNNESTIAVTFLAGLCGNKQATDLDLDDHDDGYLKGGKQISSGTAETLTFDDNGSDSCFSWDSDCDSFCDASVQEPANKEYLQKDLGASCFWDIDFSDMGEDHGALHDMPNVISEDEEVDLSDVIPEQLDCDVIERPSPVRRSRLGAV